MWYHKVVVYQLSRGKENATMFYIYRKPLTRSKGYYDLMGTLGYGSDRPAISLIRNLAQIMPRVQFIVVPLVDAPKHLPIGEAEKRYVAYECYAPAQVLTLHCNSCGIDFDVNMGDSYQCPNGNCLSLDVEFEDVPF